MMRERCLRGQRTGQRRACRQAQVSSMQGSFEEIVQLCRETVLLCRETVHLCNEIWHLCWETWQLCRETLQLCSDLQLWPLGCAPAFRPTVIAAAPSNRWRRVGRAGRVGHTRSVVAGSLLVHTQTHLHSHMCIYYISSNLCFDLCSYSTAGHPDVHDEEAVHAGAGEGPEDRAEEGAPAGSGEFHAGKLGRNCASMQGNLASVMGNLAAVQGNFAALQ